MTFMPKSKQRGKNLLIHLGIVQSIAMLTSSDAKWRCMWYLLVWSVPLTLVSQFLQLADHIPFYIFAGLSIFVLPVVTAIYSNTAGTRGASLLRVGYVFCDPVLACIAVTPVLLLNHLPKLAQEDQCLQLETWNDTCDCMEAHNDGEVLPNYRHGHEIDKIELLMGVNRRSLIIELFMGIPIILALLMWRRTRKMRFSTYLLTFAYWFIISIEAVGLVEAVWQERNFIMVVFTTETIVCLTIIITNSYAIVTLCSYISPGNMDDKHEHMKKFDYRYKIFIGAAGVMFAEIPLLVARCQLFATDPNKVHSASFLMWLAKDVVFIVLIIAMILGQNFRKKYLKLRCKVNFDNPDVIFQPERRDEYIHKKKTVHFQDPPYTTHTFGDDVESMVDVGQMKRSSKGKAKSKSQKQFSSLDDLHQLDMEVISPGKNFQSLPCIQSVIHGSDDSLLDGSVSSSSMDNNMKGSSPNELQLIQSPHHSADSVLSSSTTSDQAESPSSSNGSLPEWWPGVHSGSSPNTTRPPYRSPVRNSPRGSPRSSLTSSSVTNISTEPKRHIVSPS